MRKTIILALALAVATTTANASAARAQGTEADTPATIYPTLKAAGAAAWADISATMRAFGDTPVSVLSCAERVKNGRAWIIARGQRIGADTRGQSIHSFRVSREIKPAGTGWTFQPEAQGQPPEALKNVICTPANIPTGAIK